MQSTGNENELRQDSTIIEGAQIRVDTGNGSEDRKTPMAFFVLIGVCCFLQVVVLFYLSYCRASVTIEIMKYDKVIQERAEKTATRAALEALDRYLHGKRSNFYRSD